MSKSMSSVAPKERINIRYVPATGNEPAEIELPHKMLVLGDFGLSEDRSLEDRPILRIDKHTFNDVLKDADVSLDISVPSVLSAVPDAELAVNLRFGSIKDFGPDHIARQVPEEQVTGITRGTSRAQGTAGECPGIPQATATPIG